MKTKILKSIPLAILALLITGTTAFASFYPSGGTTYRLQSSIGTTDSSINLSSFKEPISNIAYTMTYLNSNIECGTLDPQTNKSEFISFTGITQNNDGTAQLTGVSRGLGRSYPYTASTTLALAHAGQSIFILSDSPCLFTQYPAKQNNEVVTGLWTAPDPASALGIANKEYVDGKTFGGIGNASETATGTVQIATGAQAAASTQNGSLGRLALPSSLATSTYNSATAVNRIPVTGGAGTLDSNFINTATLKFNGLTYVFPGSSGAASTTLTNDGSGNLGWFLPSNSSLIEDGTVYSSNGTSTSTPKFLVIPANTFVASTSLQVEVMTQGTGDTDVTQDLEIGNGTSTTTIASTRNNTSISRMYTTIWANSASVQTYFTQGTTQGNTASVLSGTTAIDSTAKIFLAFTYKAGDSGANAIFRGIMVRKITQ